LLPAYLLGAIQCPIRPIWSVSSASPLCTKCHYKLSIFQFIPNLVKSQYTPVALELQDGKWAEWIFPFYYFTHSDRIEGIDHASETARRSSIQAARLDVIDGVMVCPRDEELQMKLRPENDTSQISV